NEDVPLTVPANGVLGNDTDADGDTLTVTTNTTPSHGTVTVNANGSLTYTPATNYHGADSFQYTITDASLTSTATVNITVNPVNDTPVAIDAAYSTAQDTPMNIATPGVLTNDTDVDGDVLTVTTNTSPSHGTASVNAS